MNLDEWHRQEWNRRQSIDWEIMRFGIDWGRADLLQSYRVVTTWWEQGRDGRIKLLDRDQRIQWQIEIPSHRTRHFGCVDAFTENGERHLGVAEISEINVQVTPQWEPVVCDFDRRSFQLRSSRDEVEVEWTWADPCQAFRSLGEVVMQGYSDGISRNLEYMATSALSGTAQTANTAASVGVWDSRHADPLADLQRIADEMGGRGFYHQPHFAEADARAKELLLSLLDDIQRDEFQATGKFSVVSQSGKVYTITNARNFNVKTTEDGKEVALCAVLQDPSNPYQSLSKGLPIYDQMLAQMLMLQTDEAGFLKIANRKSTEWLNPITTEWATLPMRENNLAGVYFR